VNSQNNWYWSAENPRIIHKKIGVWCAISARRMIGPIFYSDIVNATRYVNSILSPFLAKRTEEERLYGVFEQDPATVYLKIQVWKHCRWFLVSLQLAVVCGPHVPLI
jgi:hypothetical protein